MIGFLKKKTQDTARAFSGWMGLEFAADMFKWIKSLFFSIFMPWKLGEEGKPETFEEAVARLRLTPKDIAAKQKMFLQQAILYLIMGFGVLIYGAFLFTQGALINAGIAALITVLALSYAFRSHFWFFQMKQKKLGCTFKEYLNASVQGEERS